MISRLLILFGLFLLFYASYRALTDFENFASIDNLESYYIPILFSILFLPFVYLVALIAAYESLYVKLSMFVIDKTILRYAKCKSIQMNHVNLSKLNQWSFFIVMNWRFKNKNDVNKAISAFKQTSLSPNKRNK